MSDLITLADGAGGEAMQRLLAQEIAVLYDGEPQWEDAAVLPADGRIAVTTDSFVVKPLVFPGGDIGKLAATGTINDLAMRGAIALYMTVALILEEGLPVTTLRQALRSLREVCDQEGVRIVAGDTKVVEKGSGDGLFINTTGVGRIREPDPPGCKSAKPTDRVLVSGPLGDHGIALLVAREELPLRTSITSDCAPLSGLVQAMLQTAPGAVHALRDLTRGGLAAALNEIALASGVQISIEDRRVPVRPEVKGACELLGFDPLHLANEGRLVAFVAEDHVDSVLQAAQAHPLGRDSAVIGEVRPGARPRVTVLTELGTSRVLSMPAGELLPRIC